MIYPEPRLLPCGDLAVSVELADEINREVNARVLALEYLIQQKAVPGITETLPTYRSLLVYYDPAVIAADELNATLRALAAEARPEVLPPARTVELPCCLWRRARVRAGGRRRQAGPGAGGDGAAARRRRLPRLLRGLHPRPALHDGDARAAQYSAPRQPAHQDTAGQRGHRRRPVLHLLGGEPGRLLGARPHAGATLRSRRRRSHPPARRRSGALPPHRARRVRRDRGRGGGGPLPAAR